ncbi:MAG: ATP synthase F1 subunit delta [Vicinamibacterales bacterium]
MKHSAIAGRYARALFDVTLKEGDFREVEAQLAAFLDLLAEHTRLKKILSSPVFPPPKKQAAIEALSSRLALSPVVRKLLAALAERDLLALLPAIVERYRRRVMDHFGVVQAEVTTAAPLGDKGMEAVREGLARVTGKQVQIAARVDPSIIGGVVARVGSVVYDGSVARHLERIREKIVEAST